ncbi:GNAT family N-acetyltransferase [Amycolatopsis lexingtonensis]|uniref:GNAT family N-acetyltransferase n=1 Tax=Amycolatopsis lexingtonensis TaxID=218822 RepID=UPI003F72FD89
MTAIEVRPARPAELEAVARLQWRWVAEQDGPPAADRDGFVREFAAWAREHADTHRCLVVVRDDEVIGMAFLAITARVPTPMAFSRAAGDVQSVYVVPEARDSGVGGRLIDATLALAAELGLERVTVHSSARAIPAYERHGFARSPHLLQARLSEPGASPVRSSRSRTAPR